MARNKTVRKDAERPLVFEVTEEHIEDAVCSDPTCCVLALAIKDRFGDLFDDIQVGITTTKLYRADGVIVRYRTPVALREALKVFDRTGKWTMPPGEYRLPPPRTDNHRLDQMPPRKTPKKTKKRKPYAKKTRTVKRIDAGGTHKRKESVK